MSSTQTPGTIRPRDADEYQSPYRYGYTVDFLLISLPQCPGLVIRPESMPSPEITSHKPTYRELSVEFVSDAELTERHDPSMQWGWASCAADIKALDQAVFDSKHMTDHLIR